MIIRYSTISAFWSCPVNYLLSGGQLHNWKKNWLESWVISFMIYLQLLGELLLDRHNFTVMTRYISNEKNLKLMMNMLREKSKNIQFEAFHVFKVCIAIWIQGVLFSCHCWIHILIQHHLWVKYDAFVEIKMIQAIINTAKQEEHD